tara:strand:+ start:375 stop:1145 length:771 start_codon:yes stop_codon:yes gene_type:complete
MASFIVYDSIQQYRSDNTISEGRMSTATDPNFTTSDSITDHERSNDQSIGTSISGIADRDAIEYAVGSNATANAVAVRFNGDDNVSSGTIMEFYIDTDRTALSAKGSLTAVSGAGWQVVDLTETTGNKFFTEFKGAVTNVSEIMFGKKLNFEVEPDANIQESFDSQNTILRSLGGTEYALNTSDPQKIFTITFGNISQTFKNDLITFQENVKVEAKKFLYYDGSNYHFVRLTGPLTFNEVADSRYSTSIQMRQQIQ